jgi:hypothetical protein
MTLDEAPDDPSRGFGLATREHWGLLGLVRVFAMSRGTGLSVGVVNDGE